MSNQQYLTLDRTNDKMPIIGFGCWKVEENVEETVYTAIKNGYRLIDGAAVYENEVGVGKGINRAISEGIVKREDLFVVSKLWNTYHNKAHVRAAMDRTLKDLNLDYVDLYIIHFPVPCQYVDPKEQYPGPWTIDGKMKIEKSPMHELWAEMEKLVDAGLARNIGISNFNCQIIMDLLTYAKYKPATLQIELHPYLQQRELVKWVKEQGLQVTAYSSFGPSSYVKLTKDAKTVTPLFEHDMIKSIADKHKKTPAQVLLRWAIDQEIAVIPKSMSSDRMKSNIDVFDFKLDEKDHADIKKLDENLRFNSLFAYGIPVPLFN
ncbi:xylose reductase [Mycotypha africana]|uniref:xylose reductase n=1 Tax=Mycotypha africana TaxID=64632 RepID=UPI002301F1C3|nr:xylose reductase [Mycotypha africana]KAI8977528.1 xylose reductase [Mycotypha africana]